MIVYLCASCSLVGDKKKLLTVFFMKVSFFYSFKYLNIFFN